MQKAVKQAQEVSPVFGIMFVLEVDTGTRRAHWKAETSSKALNQFKELRA